MFFALSYIAALVIARNNDWMVFSSVLHVGGTIACVLFLKNEMN
jgi:hypothetical protein